MPKYRDTDLSQGFPGSEIPKDYHKKIEIFSYYFFKIFWFIIYIYIFKLYIYINCVFNYLKLYY